jgi:anti-sigma factor RsiW
MTTAQPFTDEELHAAADGRLDAERLAELEGYLATHAAEAARLVFYRRLNDELHTLFDPVLAQPLPERLATRPRRSRAHWLPQVAAAVALLLVGAGGGWFARDMDYDESESPPPSFADMAVKAHTVYTAEVRHAVQVPASDEAHLTQWLSKRLDEPVHVPKLTKVGYEFVGGSLLPADEGVAAQLMYQNEAGNRVTLYFKRDGDAGTAFRYLAEGDLSTFYWRDGDFVYALTGELPRAQLLPVCNEVYEQLNPGVPAPSGW